MLWSTWIQGSLTAIGSHWSCLICFFALFLLNKQRVTQVVRLRHLLILLLVKSLWSCFNLFFGSRMEFWSHVICTLYFMLWWWGFVFSWIYMHVVVLLLWFLLFSTTLFLLTICWRSLCSFFITFFDFISFVFSWILWIVITSFISI